MEAEIGVIWPQAKECKQSLDTGKGKEQSHPEFPEGTQALILVLEDPF